MTNMDGIAGIYSPGNPELVKKGFMAVGMQQHRGKACAGGAVANRKGILSEKGLGRVGNILRPNVLQMFQASGPVAMIGNVGYTKNAIPEQRNAEPIRIDPKNPGSRYQVCLTTDGYLIDGDDLRAELEPDYLFGTGNKTEVIGALLHQAIQENGITFEAGKKVVDKLHGRATFSLVAIVNDSVDTHMVALNDSRAFEPLAFAQEDGMFIVASESCSMRRRGIKPEDISESDGAEMIICSHDGIEKKRLREEKMMPDIFQGVYFGHVGSVFRGKQIYDIRRDLGSALVEHYGVPDIDIVIPNPDSGWGVTMGCFEAIREANPDVVLHPALIKQAQAVRTFQETASRTREVGLKFGGIDSLLSGRRVLMGDDSIVRGSVSEGGSVWCVYNCGAKSIEFWISYGPMFFPSFKGWHDGRACLEELAVQRAFAGGNPYDKTEDEINREVAKLVGVNKVRYNRLERIHAVTGPGSFQALDASYPIDERWWPGWLKEEVEKFHKYAHNHDP